MLDILDLPHEVLNYILAHLDDGNATLKAVSLAGSQVLADIAHRLMIRDLRIALKFPLDHRHPFVPTFRKIVTRRITRTTIRSITFDCEGMPELELVELFAKYLPKCTDLVSVNIMCSHTTRSMYDCFTPFVLGSLFRLPLLRSLSIHRCSINSRILPEPTPSSFRALRTLILDNSWVKNGHWRHIPGPSPLSLMMYVKELDSLALRTNIYKAAVSELKLCMSDELACIAGLATERFPFITPRRLQVVCECNSAQCDLRHLTAALDVSLRKSRCLEELCITKLQNVPYNHEAIVALYDGLSTAGHDIIRRLSLRFGSLWLGGDITAICNALQRFNKLEELALDGNGTGPAMSPLLCESLLLAQSQLPGILDALARVHTLTHLYFHDPLSELSMDVLATSHVYFEAIPNLQLLAWIGYAEVRRGRDGNLFIATYNAPSWITFGWFE